MEQPFTTTRSTRDMIEEDIENDISLVTAKEAIPIKYVTAMVIGKLEFTVFS